MNGSPTQLSPHSFENDGKRIVLTGQYNFLLCAITRIVEDSDSNNNIMGCVTFKLTIMIDSSNCNRA